MNCMQVQGDAAPMPMAASPAIATRTKRTDSTIYRSQVLHKSLCCTIFSGRSRGADHYQHNFPSRPLPSTQTVDRGLSHQSPAVLVHNDIIATTPSAVQPKWVNICFQHMRRCLFPSLPFAQEII